MMADMNDDPFGLGRFVEAQNSGGTYERAVAELRAGAKTTHWMWFVLPQVAGLGLSATSVRYAINGLPEARAYLAHPVLGPRLQECASILLGLRDTTAPAVLGSVDAAKLRSSMTLFAYAAPERPVFREVLEKYFDGQEDDATTARLGEEPTPAGEEED
ncbi:DUF1810 domain-containing protein [Kineosporia mesophila]|uniref:DUF1810 domain-containing protein n=2 Tax=Kineosporia mesophila TaxID=566012 RepID=A0ABP6ZH66_9ACTN